MKKKQRKLADDIHVGKHQLGWRSIDLYVMPRQKGGWFQAVPGDGRDAQMHIGLDYDNFADCLEVLLHEAHEFNMSDLGCSFRNAHHYEQNSSDGVHFILDHNQHTEACARSAYFLLNTVDLIRDWWKKVATAKGA